jgi:transposase
MLYVGIDLSDEFFDYCITDDAGNVLNRNQLAFDLDGFSSLVEMIHSQQSQANQQEGDTGVTNESVSECVIGLENPRSTLVDFLTNEGYPVMLTQPNAIHNYRKSRTPSGAKSDPVDAGLIADYVREHHKHLTSITIAEENIRELSLLLEDRDRLVQQKVRFTNQLTSTLKEYFPQALKAFGSIDNKSAIRFLKVIDTHDQVKGISKKKLEQLLHESGLRRKDSIEKFHQAMEQPGYRTSDAVMKAKVRLKNALVEQLELLVNRIQEYEKRIRELMDDSPDGNIFRSLPGADYILGGKLLVLYSVRDFSSASEAQQLFGTAPYTAGSGKSKRVGFRKGANKLGRNTFQQLARGSIMFSTWAKRQFVKKRKEGKKGHHAFRCLANTWVKITFAMWRSKTTYDEDKHMASIARHMINQPAFAEKG